MHPRKKSITLLLASVAVYAALVATHLGEFWPFSIYPMFSVAGRPWSRAVVRELDDDDGSDEHFAWTAVERSALPGRGFALKSNGVEAIDVANYVHKTKRWDEASAAGLAALFDAHRQARTLVVYRVNGRIDDSDRINVEYVPYLLVRDDGWVLNPSLTETSP